MKPKQKSMVQNITSANCVFQRQVLPSRGYGSPMAPTFTEPFSQRVAYRRGAAPRARPGNPTRSPPPPPPSPPRSGLRLRHVPASRGQTARDWLEALSVEEGGRVPRKPALPLVMAAAVAAARAAAARRGTRWRWRRLRNGRRLPVS